jgi:regulator of sirC expression with transglutaminase-like and TPR domain
MASFAQLQSAEEGRLLLKELGLQADDISDIAGAALALGYLQMPDIHPQRYQNHLERMKETFKDCLEIARTDEGDDIFSIIKALKLVIHDDFGYQGDQETYDDLDNINFIRVIERRKGLPVALGILYLMLCQAEGIEAAGLNFPGHFLLRVSYHGDVKILDPFQNGKVMEAADLRHLLKAVAGKNAELSHRYYDAVSNRQVLVRLQNNLKTRLIEHEDYGTALEIVESIRLLIPQDARTYLDEGVLSARIGEKNRALSALESYLASLTDPAEQKQIHGLIRDIHSDLN